MTRKLIKITAILIAALSISVSLAYAFVYEQQLQNVTQIIKDTKLWVDSFDSTRDQWAKNGSSPYLDVQDDPTNYVYGEPDGVGSQDGEQIGDFGFEDHSQTGTINSVILRIYGHGNPSRPNQNFFSVHLWDGTSWNEVMDFRGEANYIWKEVDVSAYLDTWDKVNGAKIYLEAEARGLNRAGQACDAAVLVVDYQ